MSIVVAYDAIHDNVSRLPAGQVAGYTTGTSDIRWTDADWANHPGAVRIDQDFVASDPSADVLDVETGAATFADCPHWAKQAQSDYRTGLRRGQRTPAIYFSASNVHNVVNALVNGGVSGGVGLWVASWGIGEQNAIAEVASASGPFPIIGVQYSNGTFFDYDVFSQDWLENVSGDVAVNPVKNLHEIHRGFTSITLAWDSAKNATSYTVKAYWRGKFVKKEATTTPGVRMRNLLPRHTYEFKVRAHPAGSVGADATVKSTTR